MSRGGNGSHWAGCEEAHHDCALVLLAEARAEVERLSEIVDGCSLLAKAAPLFGFRPDAMAAEIIKLRAEVERLLAALERIRDTACDPKEIAWQALGDEEK